MAARRNALGRGLDALLPEKPEPVLRDETAANPRQELAVDQIRPNPEQPRRTFDEAELAALADSLRQHGVLQPVVVRALPGDAGPPSYELVVGERRWRAARAAGLATIPATIADLAPREVLEVALVENVQRQDLNPIELAMAFRALTDAGATQQDVGQRVGMERSTVANHLRLLELPRDVQEDVEAGRLTTGHAKALLQIGHPERRLHLRDRILAEGLSVRASEDLARRLGAGGDSGGRRAKAGAEVVDPHLAHLLDQLRDRLQTQVKISGTSRRGKIEVDFHGEAELTRLAEAILERG